MKASATVEVRRPIEDVFSYVADVEAMDEWVVGVGETRRVSGEETTVGTRYESTYTYGGRTQPMVLELTAIDAPHRLEMTAVEGPFPFDARLDLSETPQGTLVTNTIDNKPDGRFTAVMFTLFRPLMRWLMARQLRGELRELKARLEADVETYQPPAPGETSVN
ncbi:SRPBCC family protein [Haloferax namakaokahaiae]|uniref:SRPBCC family protein n=1 Tax=Haloferax namakaokahaiae TaxID=1748331 RepID=A0ABD5ZBH3_9EURY